MAAALDARFLSGLKEERVAASAVLSGPADVPKVDRAQLVDDVRQALYAAKICSYAQGMNLIREAAKQLKWTIDLGECARIWKGGCIIRAKVSSCARARVRWCGAAHSRTALAGANPDDDPALYMLDVLRGDADARNSAELTGRRRGAARGGAENAVNARSFAPAQSLTLSSIHAPPPLRARAPRSSWTASRRRTTGTRRSPTCWSTRSSRTR
jgi:hypothetical protein